jgi:hypothetical protein
VDAVFRLSKSDHRRMAHITSAQGRRLTTTDGRSDTAQSAMSL